MSALAKVIAEKAERLAPHRQAEVLDFVERLAREEATNGRNRPLVSPLGLLSKYADGNEVSELEGQRDEWHKTFPRGVQ